MNAYFKRLFIVICLLCFAAAQAKDVHVKGYTRKDGTYVAPYTRSAPNHTKADNYSTKGNVNPYTGKAGTKAGDGDTAAPDAPSAADTEQHAAQASRVNASWDKLRPGMTKADVIALLGDPNIKTAGKWVYTEGGTVRFDDKGLTQK